MPFEKYKQRGFAFLPFLLANWQIIAIGLLVLTVVGYYKHCESVKDEYATFKAETKRAGEEQARRTQETIARNLKEKERLDAENKRTIDKFKSDIARLRKYTNPSGGSVSSSPSGSKCPPEQVCFDRAEYQRAYGGFVEEARGLADEGTQVTIDLETARQWANR